MVKEQLNEVLPLVQYFHLPNDNLPREVTPVSDQSSEPLSASIGEQFLSDYSVHELSLEVKEEPGNSDKG